VPGIFGVLGLGRTFLQAPLHPVLLRGHKGLQEGGDGGVHVVVVHVGHRCMRAWASDMRSSTPRAAPAMGTPCPFYTHPRHHPQVGDTITGPPLS